MAQTEGPEAHPELSGSEEDCERSCGQGWLREVQDDRSSIEGRPRQERQEVCDIREERGIHGERPGREGEVECRDGWGRQGCNHRVRETERCRWDPDI